METLQQTNGTRIIILKMIVILVLLIKSQFGFGQPLPPFILGPTAVCPGAQYYYSIVNFTPDCTQFAWQAINGSIVSANGPTVYVVWNGTTTGTLNCDLNCPIGHITVTVAIITPPSLPTLSKNSSHYEICSGETWTLTCNSLQGNNFGYDWYVSYVDPSSGSGVLLDGGVFSQNIPHHTLGNTVQLTSPSGYGSFFVNVRLNSGQPFTCPSGWTHLQGQAGVYNSSQFSINGPSFVCQNATASYSSSYNAGDILSEQWGWSGNFNYQGGQGTNFLYVSANSYFTGGAIMLKLQNRCGLTGSPNVKGVGGGNCGGYRITASPNPVGANLRLTLEQDGSVGPLAKTASQISTLSATLVNSNNEVAWSGNVNADIFNIDVSDLPNGFYFLKLYDGSGYTVQRILISH